MNSKMMLLNATLPNGKFHLMLDSAIAYCLAIVLLYVERAWVPMENVSANLKCSQCL